MLLDIKFLVINCFGYYDSEPNAFDLLMFALGSIVIVSMLLFYYNRIPKSNRKEDDVQVEKTISRFPKFLAYLLFIIPSTILVIEFFNFGNLFTIFDIIILSLLISLLIYSNINVDVKKNVANLKLDNPIYRSKDFILESINHNDRLFFNKESLRASSKIIIYSLVAIFIITPLVIR